MPDSFPYGRAASFVLYSFVLFCVSMFMFQQCEVRFNSLLVTGKEVLFTEGENRMHPTERKMTVSSYVAYHVANASNIRFGIFTT